MPTLIASPILGVNATSSSYAMNIIGKKKKPHELAAIEIGILSVLLVANVKKTKLIIVIRIEMIADRFKTEIWFLVCCIFIIIRQKKMLPGIPSPVNSIPKVDVNLSSSNPKGSINYPTVVEKTKKKMADKLTAITVRM